MDPSGSSSGSGLGSSIGLALASSGTETDCSILSLLSVNNLIGIKPTVGLTSRFLLFQLLNTKKQLARNMILWPFASHLIYRQSGLIPNLQVRNPIHCTLRLGRWVGQNRFHSSESYSVSNRPILGQVGSISRFDLDNLVLLGIYLYVSIKHIKGWKHNF
jgi:hypothetical protein